MKCGWSQLHHSRYTDEEYRQKYIIGGAKTVLEQAIEDKEKRDKLREEKDNRKQGFKNKIRNIAMDMVNDVESTKLERIEACKVIIALLEDM